MKKGKGDEWIDDTTMMKTNNIEIRIWSRKRIQCLSQNQTPNTKDIDDNIKNMNSMKGADTIWLPIIAVFRYISFVECHNVTSLVGMFPCKPTFAVENELYYNFGLSLSKFFMVSIYLHFNVLHAALAHQLDTFTITFLVTFDIKCKWMCCNLIPVFMFHVLACFYICHEI